MVVEKRRSDILLLQELLLLEQQLEHIDAMRPTRSNEEIQLRCPTYAGVSRLRSY